MRNKIKNLLLIAVVALIVSAPNGFAQIKTGGYKKISATDAGAMAAAEYAAKTQSEKEASEIVLQNIKTAQSQTVAGTNYKLCIEVSRAAQSEANEEDEEAEEIKQFVQTVIFRNLKKEYQLKSWQEVESCGEEK